MDSVLKAKCDDITSRPLNNDSKIRRSKNTTKSRINTYNAVLRVTESKFSMYKNSNR